MREGRPYRVTPYQMAQVIHDRIVCPLKCGPRGTQTCKRLDRLIEALPDWMEEAQGLDHARPIPVHPGQIAMLEVID